MVAMRSTDSKPTRILCGTNDAFAALDEERASPGEKIYALFLGIDFAVGPR